MECWTVYKIVETITNRVVYIGVTSQNVKMRWRGHTCRNPLFRKNHKIIPIFRNLKDSTAAGTIEKLLISIYATYKPENGYNKTRGGVGTDTLNNQGVKDMLRRRWSDPENRRQFSEKMISLWADPEYKTKLKQARTGHIVTQQARQNISAALTGKSHVNERRVKIAETARAKQTDRPPNVFWNKKNKKYQVLVSFNDVRENFGYYETIEAAAQAAEVARQFHAAGTPIDNIKHSIFTAKRFKP